MDVDPYFPTSFEDGSLARPQQFVYVTCTTLNLLIGFQAPAHKVLQVMQQEVECDFGWESQEWMCVQMESEQYGKGFMLGIGTFREGT